jgi:hypothetical protein
VLCCGGLGFFGANRRLLCSTRREWSDYAAYVAVLLSDKWT